MNSEDFNKCREFLQDQIQSTENVDYKKDLLQVYVKLLEQKSNYDRDTDRALIEQEIKKAEFDAQVRQNFDTQNAVVQQNWENNQTTRHNNFHDNYAAVQQNYDTGMMNFAQTAVSQNPQLLSGRSTF